MTIQVSQLPDPTAPLTTQSVETIDLIWDDRLKGRQRLVTDQGTEVVLTLPRGSVLADGDVLYQDDQRRIRIRALPEAVVRIPFGSVERLGKICHHLGNWHRPVQILADGTLLAQVDNPLVDWLVHAGIPFEQTEYPFHPNLRGHSH